MEITFPMLRGKVKCVMVKAAFHHYCDGFCKIKTNMKIVRVIGLTLYSNIQCQTKLPWQLKELEFSNTRVVRHKTTSMKD